MKQAIRSYPVPDRKHKGRKIEAGREEDRRQQGQARQPEADYETGLSVDPITTRE